MHFENADGVPFSDRLVFNKIQDFTTDGLPNNIFHDKSTVVLRNTGQSTLTVSSLVVSAGWTLVGAPVGAFNIAPGGSQNITLQFTANPGGSNDVIFNGTLTVNSNDADEPASIVRLAGHWQPQNEGNGDEPTLQDLVNIFGYKTVITKPGELLNQSGKIARVGDEVLSPYWHRADASAPVTVRQLSAYHSMPNIATIYWHNKGSNTTMALFTMDGEEAQSMMPHKNNASTGVVGTEFANGSFSPAGSFGLKIDSEWSDPAKNSKPNPQDQGHHVRWWVVRDRAGKIIPNTYIVTMDYSGINYDYQDNTYLITNIQPDSPPSVPAGLTASGAGISLNWNDNTEANLAGYNVYRSTTSGGTYTKLNAALLASSDYLDGATSIGVTYFYKVTAIDNAGNESAQTAFVSATRTSDATPPGAPSGLVATGATNGVSLDWANNPEGDVAGYNIYRSSSAAGPFTTKLNVNPVGMSAYVDTTAPVGVVSYYKVTAVDSSNNESAGAFANATRPGNDTTKPAAPSGVVPTPSPSGISIDWADNSEQDLAGYNIYRSPDGVNNWQKLNTGGLLANSFYNDTGAAVGINYYRITAVDTSNNESDPASFNATRPPADTTKPAAPAGLGASDSPSGVNLNWDDNTELDLAGYNVYRSPDGVNNWTKLNGNLLLVSNYLDATANPGANFYRVSAVDSSSNESDFATTAKTHVVAFTHVEIGNPTPAGSLQTITQNKDYNLAAGGADIWGANDQFGFAYQQVSGDFDLVVRLAGLSNSSSLAKAGLMARESLAANARNIMGYATPSAGYRTTYRTATGGSTVATGSGSTAYPNTWLRLTRTGNTFATLRSSNGVDWTPLASTTLNVGQTMYVGMAATSHNTTVLTTAQFRDLANLLSPPDAKPAAPTGLITLPRQTGVLMGWDSNSESDLQGYNVYRSDTIGGTYTLLNTTGLLNNIAYMDKTAVAETTYFYRVTAVDLANQESDPSAPQSGTRPLDVAPPPPSSATATGTASGITLEWVQDASDHDDIIGFNVYSSDAVDGTFTKLNASVIQDNTYQDTTAPTGVPTFYRVFTVDATGHVSATAATASATRTVSDDPPAQPQNFLADASVDGIELTWDANTDSDLAGYHLYRSTNGVDWTQLDGLMTFTAFNDTFAETGVLTTYRLAAVDNANQESTFAIVSATRPAPQPTIKINFQIAGSPTVAGYEQDNGFAFADRGNGLTYGWSGNFSNNARDRNMNADQLLDTLMQFWSGSSWSMALANGNYSVKVSVGDSQYASTHTLEVNGQTVFDDVPLAKNQFQQTTVNVAVTNGKLTLSAVGQIANQATRINYIEITPL